MLKYLINIKITAQISSIIFIYLCFMLPNVFAANTGEMACKRAGVKADTFMNI